MISKTVLVADDDSASRKLLCDILHLLGHKTLQAVDGLDALDQAQTQHPDIVLLDIQMPKLSGFEVLARLKTQNALAVPVIAVTALAMEDDRRRVFAAGFDGYISKPISIAAIRTALTQCI